MYNIYGFGKRISSYRKLQDMTQEELAARLGITAQAISKWENEISFPDITILPLLAKELNTTIEKLFGNEEEALRNAAIKEYYVPRFPESKGAGLKLVHTLGGVACYSEKDVDVTNEDTVIFKDGSSANLRYLKIINKGIGEICFDFNDEIPVYRNIDMSKTERQEKFDGINSVEMFVTNASFKLIRSDDSSTHIKAAGSPVFIDGLEIRQTEGVLLVKCEQENNRGGNSGYTNKVIIAFGSDSGENIRIDACGVGDIEVEVPFRKGYAFINGSGDITVADIDDFEGKINGSGDFRCGKIGNPSININGSGDFTIGEVFGSFKASINGSGDINLGNGEVDKFEAAIRGSGDITADGVSTRTANISIDGSGDIIVGRVKEESVEKHSKNSSIKILKRG